MDSSVAELGYERIIGMLLGRILYRDVSMDFRPAIGNAGDEQIAMQSISNIAGTVSDLVRPRFCFTESGLAPQKHDSI